MNEATTAMVLPAERLPAEPRSVLFRGERARRVRRALVDALLVALAILVSFSLRFGGPIPAGLVKEVALLTALALVAILPIFVVSGIYRVPWHLMGLRDVVTVGFAVLVATVLMAVLALVWHAQNPWTMFPRSVILLQAPITFLALAGVRMFPRVIRAWWEPRPSVSVEHESR